MIKSNPVVGDILDSRHGNVRVNRRPPKGEEKNWHKFFAWLPVKDLETGKRLWLQYVERCWAGEMWVTAHGWSPEPIIYNGWVFREI